MEGVTFLDDDIQKGFGKFVEILLHTDGGGDFRETSLANRAMLRNRFDTVSVPYYAVLDPTGTKVYWEGGGVFDADQVLEALATAP